MRRYAIFAVLVVLFGAPAAGCDAPSAARDASTALDADAAAEPGDAGALDAGPPAPLPPRGTLALEARNDGTIALSDSSGTTYAPRVFADALVRDTAGTPRTVSTAGCTGAWEDSAEAPGARAFRCEAGGIVLRWSVWRDAPQAVLFARLDLSQSPSASAPIILLRASPFVTEGPQGGLFLGNTLGAHRILDDGADIVRDTESHLYHPFATRNATLGILPIAPRGNVVSNVSAAVADLEGGRHLGAGFLTTDDAFPTVGFVGRATGGPIDPATRRAGFSAVYADTTYLFDGVALSTTTPQRGELFWLTPLAESGHAALERYGDAVAAHHGIVPWHARGASGRAVPIGWNSWSGGSGAGGLGQSIDESILSGCLDVMARELQPFGATHFQVDDGYQVRDGDWVTSSAEFPTGMDGFNTRVRAAGLEPGIWIKAFVASLESEVARTHPDWLLGPDDNALGGLLSPGTNSRVLDLSNADVRTWLSDTMRRYEATWGERFVKLDFAYLALPYRFRASPRYSAIRSYRDGLRAVRTGLSGDVFQMGIGLPSLNYGIADGMRTTLDNGPRWQENDPFSTLGESGSIQCGVKSAARRYWLNGRVFTNHDDGLFFRSHPDYPDAPLTLSESITLASFLGLRAGIVDLGEDLRTLTPPQLQVARAIMPVYAGHGARPLDVFTRHYPEQYALDVQAGGQSWTVLGLLNWGRNYDFSAPGAPRELPEAARAYVVELAALGLDPQADYLVYEFWTERALGTVRGSLTREVAARGHEVLALRRVTGAPQLLGTNRHVTVGGTDLVSERWNAATRTLELRFRLDAVRAGGTPFEYRIHIHAPAGYVLDPARAPAEGALTQDADVVTYRLTPSAPGMLTLDVAFR